MRSAEGESKQGMVPWEPNRHLLQISPEEVAYSRGFLRCKPERWFPGFAAHWAPLGHLLGMDFRVAEVKPVISYPRDLAIGYVGSIDNEPMGIFLDDTAARFILDPALPGGSDISRELLLEYLARRLLTSLGACWSGPESSKVAFDSEADPSSINGVGAIKFAINLNGTTIAVWLVLGTYMVDRLDGLWRRQIQSSGKPSEGDSHVSLEVAQLAVPPSMLAEYLRPGTAVDLESPVTDSITLRIKGKGWVVGKMRAIGSRLGVEISSTQTTALKIPEGSTRLSLSLGSVTLDPGAMAELSQPGAVLDTAIRLSNRLAMLINGEQVGEAGLSVYEGRLAISVG